MCAKISGVPALTPAFSPEERESDATRLVSLQSPLATKQILRSTFFET